MDADNIKELIDWEAATEPIFTCDLDQDQLLDVKFIGIDLPEYDCHNQGCERCVKKVTAASETVFGYAAQDGFIRGRALHRQLMPSFKSKKDVANLKKLKVY